MRILPKYTGFHPRYIVLILGIFVVLQVFYVDTFVHAKESNVLPKDMETANEEAPYYSEYITEYANDAQPDETVQAVYKSGSASEAKVIMNSDYDTIRYSYDVKTSGLYQFYIEYMPIEDKGGDIDLSLYIDGEIPFMEARNILYPRLWENETHDLVLDAIGNQLRPRQVEIFQNAKRSIIDKTGLNSEPLNVYLSAGNHDLELVLNAESVELVSVYFANEAQPVSYTDAEREYAAAGYQNVSADVNIHIQGEHASVKSNPMLYPLNDRSSSATEPSHYSRIRFNTIGGENWIKNGQSISWDFYAPESGLYKISIKARQNYVTGLSTYRNLYIDGKVPFEEARNISFPYALDWARITLGGEEPDLVYLEKGHHTITLEATTGSSANSLNLLTKSIREMNDIYRKVIMITSVTPDKYRNYNLEKKIPDLIERMESIKAMLVEVSESLKESGKGAGNVATLVDQVSAMLDNFILDSETLPERLNKYKENLEYLGSLVLTLSDQPLEIDYIDISSPSFKENNVKQGFFAGIVYAFRSFIASFTDDYKSIGENYEDGITVWVSTGRDQAQIIRGMIDDLYTPKTNIRINLEIVDTGSTLIQAALAGKGPDIALMIGKDVPVNLAMRGALVDLSALQGFEKFDGRFYDSAWIPYKYKGGTYAIPETQGFDMLFYREDILNELGIAVPQTWEDFYKAIAELQSNNLQVGLLETDDSNPGVSSGISTFDRFLYQKGGRYYDDELKRTEFSSDVAYEAFQEWVELYSLYSLPRTFDFFNRFRTGEMPMSIQNYGLYNKLAQAAPDIAGLWKMAPIPGTLKPDGTIDRTETAVGTGCIMLSGIKNKDAGLSFMEWWTSAEVQIQFGNELEGILGPAARVNTANKEAFSKLRWTDEEAKALTEQWEWVTDVPQIPGNYYVNRMITNAFRMCVIEQWSPRYALNTYNRDINYELARKSEEFSDRAGGE